MAYSQAPPTASAPDARGESGARREHRVPAVINQRTAKTLERVGAGLRREGLEGTAWLMPGGGVAAFVLTTWRVHHGRYNPGRRALSNRLREALGDEHANVEDWFERLGSQGPATAPRPPTI